jgi:hypothetical protein
MIRKLGNTLYPYLDDGRARKQAVRWLRANQYIDSRGIRIPRATRIEGMVV